MQFIALLRLLHHHEAALWRENPVVASLFHRPHVSILGRRHLLFPPSQVGLVGFLAEGDRV